MNLSFRWVIRLHSRHDRQKVIYTKKNKGTPAFCCLPHKLSIIYYNQVHFIISIIIIIINIINSIDSLVDKVLY